MTLPNRDISVAVFGQSNVGAFAQLTYGSVSFFELEGANDANSTAENNVFGAVVEELGATYGRGGMWAKWSAGSQSLSEFAPGGAQYAGVQSIESRLVTQFGRIDLVFVICGETDASNAVSQPVMEGFIDDFLGGFAAQPGCVIMCSPIDIDAVPDPQLQTIRDAYDARAAVIPYLYIVDLGSVSDDEQISGSHMVLPATIQSARDLILPVWLSLYPS